MSATEVRFPLAEALTVARDIQAKLIGGCRRSVVAGSIRRKKPLVGDIEIVYVPAVRPMPDPTDLFGPMLDVNVADCLIEEMRASGMLQPRKTVKGSDTMGVRNKLMRHVGSGIPVDLFATTEGAWFNYLVCRTGPAELNMEIAYRAKAVGWKWNPYGVGFSRRWPATWDGRTMCSEQDVFSFVGLPWMEPEERTEWKRFLQRKP